MTVISLSPEFPIPNQKVKSVFTLGETGSNFIRVWATVAPPGSSIDKLIKSTKDPRNRVELYADSGGLGIPYEYTFDKGGKYTFICQEYIKGSGYGGGYQGDPAGSDSEEKVGSESTLIVYIGQKLTQKIGPPENRAEIHLWVWNDTIRQTYKIIHGEDTPCVTATSPNSLVRSAIESSSVKTACLNLINNTVVTILGDLPDIVSDYCFVWNDHIVDGAAHIDVDDANSISNSYISANTAFTLKDFVNFALSVQRFHFSNDSHDGPDSGNYHSEADRKNISLYSSVGSFDEAYGALSDLVRTYSAHDLDAFAHSSTNDHPLATRPLLMSVHESYLSIIGSSDPTPAPAQSSGAQLLISGAGFKEI